MEQFRTPVLIVGGGATGMGLANELGYREIDCTVAEKGDGQVRTPKTGHISARTMEHCRRWGFVEEVRNCGFPRDLAMDTVLCTSLAGYELARKKTPSINDTRPLPGSPENRIRCPQMWFDPLLASKAREWPSVSARYGLDFEKVVRNDTSGVVAELRNVDSGERVEVACDYLVGADGANSAVRQATGTGMMGNPRMNYSLIVLFRCENFFQYHDKGPGERFTFIRPDGWHGNFTAINGTDLWRYADPGQEHHYDLEKFDPRRVVLDGFGREDVEFEVLQVVPWKRTELSAERFVSGRIFLAGDAAHTLSPTGGFGMNTAVDDAVNLGWKLEALVRGWGGPRLAASYEEERRPVAMRNGRMASRNFELWRASQTFPHISEPGLAGEADRARAASAYDEVAGRVQGSAGVILGYRYDNSGICIANGSVPMEDSYSEYVPSCQPGSRAPHAWIRDQESTLDLFGPGYVLFSSDASSNGAALLRAAAERRSVPVTRYSIEELGLAEVYDREMVLVRPDGHVCYAGEPSISDTGEAEEVIRRVSGHSVPVPVA